MDRKDFIRLSLLGGLGTSLLPSWMPSFFQEPDMAVLTGQDQANIVGNAYASRMHKDVVGPFLAMQRAAAKDGIAISPVSAFRSYQRQKEIFEGKFERFTNQGMDAEAAVAKIIEYSTIPGTSRHHWGTDLDLIDAAVTQPQSSLIAENYHGNGPYCRLKEWLDQHASSFDFHLVYTNNYHRKGFKYEPWHYSYAPVSVPYLKAYKQLDLQAFFADSSLKGKEVLSPDFMDRYRTDHILDINPVLLP